MQAIIDHVGAFIIGTTLLFLIAAMQWRSQDAAMQAAQVDAGKAGLRLLVDMIEQDVNNMGSGMEHPNNTSLPLSGTTVIESFGASGSYTALTFWGLTSATGTPEPQLITYRWKKSGTATLSNGTTVDTHLVERLVGSPGTLSGASFSNVTAFNVALAKADLGAVPAGSADYRLVRYVNVDLAMVSPLGPEATIEQTRWSKRFRPVNLNAEARNVIRIRP